MMRWRALVLIVLRLTSVTWVTLAWIARHVGVNTALCGELIYFVENFVEQWHMQTRSNMLYVYGVYTV